MDFNRLGAHKTTMHSLGRGAIQSFLLFFLALPLAYLIFLINQNLPNQPERAAGTVGLIFILIFSLPLILYLLIRRKLSNPWKLSWMAIATACLLLTSIYFFWVSAYIRFPADILSWSESDFINDIIKIRNSYPIYSAQANNESFIYTPGTQMITYGLTKVLNLPKSIPMFRFVQMIYIFLAAIGAVFCWRRLCEILGCHQEYGSSNVWQWVALPIFFLIATNRLTNPYVHTLHNDGLSLLISIVAYWLLLEYTQTRKILILAFMCVIPAVGFFTKQSLAIWAPLYCIYLAIFDNPRSFLRLTIFSLVSFGLIALTVGIGYLIWGEHFIYWIFSTAKHPRSILRTFQHLLDVWVYFGVFLISGYILLRENNLRRGLGLWVIVLLLFLCEIYTSGIAWMLNHMGPASLIIGVWSLAALTRIWPMTKYNQSSEFHSIDWLRSGIFALIILLIFNGLGLIRIPVNPISEDAYRYVREIEEEFKGQPIDKTLLDIGSWVYFKEGIVMKDRAVPLGDRGYSGIADFSGIIRRLKEKRYSKIMVRNLHSRNFAYDYWMWPSPSGIRQALLENYQVTRRIEAVKGTKHNEHPYYYFDEISVLVPKPNG